MDMFSVQHSTLLSYNSERHRRLDFSFLRRYWCRAISASRRTAVGDEQKFNNVNLVAVTVAGIPTMFGNS